MQNNSQNILSNIKRENSNKIEILTILTERNK